MTAVKRPNDDCLITEFTATFPVLQLSVAQHLYAMPVRLITLLVGHVDV